MNRCAFLLLYRKTSLLWNLTKWYNLFAKSWYRMRHPIYTAEELEYVNSGAWKDIIYNF